MELLTIFLFSILARHINGVIVPVDGGSWLHKPPIVPKETIRAISRAVEARSRTQSKL